MIPMRSESGSSMAVTTKTAVSLMDINSKAKWWRSVIREDAKRLWIRETSTPYSCDERDENLRQVLESFEHEGGSVYQSWIDHMLDWVIMHMQENALSDRQLIRAYRKYIRQLSRQVTLVIGTQIRKHDDGLGLEGLEHCAKEPALDDKEGLPASTSVPRLKPSRSSMLLLGD